MTNTAKEKHETISLIKEAAYDLQIGPTEISYSKTQPSSYCVKFENSTGAELEVFVPLQSTYRWIYDTLKHAQSRG